MKGIRETIFALIGLWLLAVPAASGAWSFQGHEIVGAVADRLLGGTRAAAAVQAWGDVRRYGERLLITAPLGP
jgi:hypothetical protein